MSPRDQKTLLLGSPSAPEHDDPEPAPVSRSERETRRPPSRLTTRKGTEIIDPDEAEEPSSVSPSVVPSPPPVSSRRSTTEIMRTSITEGRRSTTLVELSVVADDLATEGTRRLWMVGGGSTLLALALALVVLLDLPGWIRVLLVLVPLGMLVSTVAGSLLKRVTRALNASGRRELPGGVHWYVGAVATVVVGVSLGATWGTVEAATVVSERLLPPRITPPKNEEVVERPRLASRLADREVKKGGRAERLAPGLLYVPSSFSSSDGAFDVLIHFHGFPPLVQDSVEAAKLNAVVLSVNLGLGGGPYKARMAYRDAFDGLVDKIEKRMADNGLEKARVRRVAVSAWSAGYGAVFTLLEDPKRNRRVDALLLLDTPHGSFVGGARDIQPESVAPYVDYARLAIDGKRLMVVTHSAITTDDYPSTTETTDLILRELRLERSPGGERVDTPDFETATSAFPGGDHAWLEPTSTCRAGQLAVLGFAGRRPENHIAHLAQMSQTALPLLVRRWR